MSVNQTFRGKADLTTSGTLFEVNYIGQTDPGVLQTLINYIVPLNKKLITLQIFASCRLETKLSILVDSSYIGTGRTGPGKLNYKYSFEPYREINSGENLKVECLSMSFRPQTDIEVFIQGRLIDA